MAPQTAASIATVIEPMLASLMDAPLNDPQLVYEPKYDGIRAVADVSSKGVRLWSRLGNDKTQQFPEIARALAQWGRRLKEPVTLDGEIVALDAKGKPAGFQQLQGRIHLMGPPGEPGATSRPSVAYITFDLLQEGRRDWRDRPLTERRSALERVLARGLSPIIRISAQVRGDGAGMYKTALAEGWEGLIAKNAASLYKSGKRTPDWRKLKILHEQEFVIGGWTEPRHTRTYFGALLLGVFDDRDGSRGLTYVGHIGTGFSEKELARVMQRLATLETRTSPFRDKVKSNEKAHWVKPELVAQVKFTEWTSDGRLRHPVYLGLRDDKKAADVHREDPRKRESMMGTSSARASHARPPGPHRSRSRSSISNPDLHLDTADLVEQLSALEKAKRDGTLRLPDGDELAVTNLAKVFWPKLKYTKGDLFRYYARVAPYLLPVIADRPLVMKRFPNGVAAKPFYQHRADKVPPGVRTEVVGVAERRSHIIGGSLKGLLYTTQLAAISQDPWFSRVQHPQFADHVALDLDPADGVPFERCLDVARWIRDELEQMDAAGWPKTSGADGLHVYIPLPPGTPYEAGLLFCQIIATMVARKHPNAATVERSVAARGKRIYVDYLQNILGKTLASAYSARASNYAGVSTPLSWDEVDSGVDRRDFTIASVADRLARVGDLWKGLRTSPGVNLERAARHLKKTEK
jgi:bifunctional non-homologous end joining protein LigD